MVGLKSEIPPWKSLNLVLKFGRKITSFVSSKVSCIVVLGRSSRADNVEEIELYKE